MSDCHNAYCFEPGQCKCYDGWMGDNCSEPVCSNVMCCNGECAFPNKCVCSEGWSGDNCTEPLCLSGCNPIGGYCIKPGECLCKSGWTGLYCNESSIEFISDDNEKHLLTATVVIIGE